VVNVSVVIVNLNGASLLDDCLGSLAKQTYVDFEVIFVDNGSSDGSLKRAEELCPGIHVIALQQNVGFARGNNLGIRESRGRHIVLLNNDTQVASCFLEELVRAADRDPGIGMVAPKILDYFDRTRIDSIGGLVMCRDGIAQGRGRGERDEGQYDGIDEIFFPSGCAALYRRELLEELGGFDECFFAYCEDTDLGLRARWAGWKAVSAPHAVVYHKYSATSAKYSPFKLFLVERNHYWLAIKSFPATMLLVLPAATLWRWMLMAYAVLARRGKGQAAAPGSLGLAFLRAHLAAMAGGIGALRRRARPRRISTNQFVRLVKSHRLSLRAMILND